MELEGKDYFVCELYYQNLTSCGKLFNKALKRLVKNWSGQRESNPHHQLGRLR